VRDEPTAVDRENVRFGLLEIIRRADMTFLGTDGQWYSVPSGSLTCVEGELANLPPTYGAAPART
jgi:hypothetical protein